MDSLFDRFFQGWPALTEHESMAIDVERKDNEVVVRADVPGFEENELNVEIQNDQLTIQAEKEQKGDGQRGYRRFFRSMTLPQGVSAEKAEAHYRNGVLELHLPMTEQAKGRRVPISRKEEAGGQIEHKEHKKKGEKTAKTEGNATVTGPETPMQPHGKA